MHSRASARALVDDSQPFNTAAEVSVRGVKGIEPNTVLCQIGRAQKDRGSVLPCTLDIYRSATVDRVFAEQDLAGKQIGAVREIQPSAGARCVCVGRLNRIRIVGYAVAFCSVILDVIPALIGRRRRAVDGGAQPIEPLLRLADGVGEPTI